MTELLSLLDDAKMGTLLPSFKASIRNHHVKTLDMMRQLGAVVPGNTFWEREELRYVHIMPTDSTLVVPVRELVQNSSDAKTTELRVNTHSIYSGVEFPSEKFVSFADTGRWCPESESRTYDVCCEFFLFMNGSSKSQSKNDGGFGVGRFIILFCAPLWFFTTRHMLVLGEYGTFQILCRRCFEPLKGAQCRVCGLHEQETPVGTVFYVGYKTLQTIDLKHYLDRISRHYLRYCKLSFPVWVADAPLVPYAEKKVIFQGPWFTVSALEGHSWASNYVVRSASGVAMFTRTIHESESGTFAVDLSPSVNYTHFDQARRNLLGEPGLAFDRYIESRQGAQSSSANLALDAHHTSLGVDPVSLCFPHPLVFPSPPTTKEALANLRVEIDALPIDTPRTSGEGLLQYEYFFRNGQTMETIEERWRPNAQTDDHLWLMLIWVRCLYLCLRDPNFSVGFIFDEQTRACKKGKTYYLNPALAEGHGGSLNHPEQIPRLIMCIWSLAAHETSHRASDRHDEAFALQLTETMFATAVRNLETKELQKIPALVRKQVKTIRGRSKKSSRKAKNPAPTSTSRKSKRQKRAHTEMDVAVGR